MVEVDIVNGRNGGIRIRIGRQQDPTSIRIEFDGLGKKLRTRHPGHSLINQEKRNRYSTLFKLLYCVESQPAGGSLHHAIDMAIVLTQVPLNGIKHLRFIVDCENNRLSHLGISLFCYFGMISMSTLAPSVSVL